ncbi:MAG: GNAT family N-acetyltransferase [Gemmatimonadaceae bacterium]
MGVRERGPVTTIRRAVRGDVDLLARLNQVVHDLHVAERPDQFVAPTSNAVRHWFRDRLSEPTTRCWIAEVDGTPAGYVLAFHHARDGTTFTRAREWCEIDQLAVAPEHRRQGIGLTLLETVIRDARERKVEGIEVSAWAFNADMHRLLGRAGFARKVLRFELPPR